MATLSALVAITAYTTALPAEISRFRDAVVLRPVPVAEQGLDHLPQGQQVHPHRDQPHQDSAEGLLRQLMDRARRRGRALAVTERQL